MAAKTTVKMLEAKSSLHRLVESPKSGAEDEIIIARNGKPAARLVPIAKTAPVAKRIGVATACLKRRPAIPRSADDDECSCEGEPCDPHHGLRQKGRERRRRHHALGHGQKIFPRLESPRQVPQGKRIGRHTPSMRSIGVGPQ